MDEADSMIPLHWQQDDVSEEFNLVIVKLPNIYRKLYFSAVEEGAMPVDALAAVMRLFTPDRPGERED